MTILKSSLDTIKIAREALEGIGLLKTFIKGAIASIVMYIIMRIAYNYIFIYGSRFALESRKFIAFNCFISVILGMSTYLIVVLALKVKEVKEIFDAILFKLKNYFI